ncbi:MAG TPA: hypothetical protein VL134_02480, partial [Leptolyngbya sp.]|nr:hypothetical protein [Leptolyngbya sp.]
MKRIQSVIAIGLVGSFAFSTAKPAQSQAQVLAPAVCATGVGCVLIGVATVGGIAYWVWQNNQTGTTLHVPFYQARPRKPKVASGQM